MLNTGRSCSLCVLWLLAVTLPTADTHKRVLMGQDVLLSCSCPGQPKDLFLSWQIGEDIVDYYPPGDSKVERSFWNRTHLFLPADRGNCSLLLRNVSPADSNNYTCNYKTTCVNDNCRHAEHMDHSVVSLHVAGNYRAQLIPGVGENLYSCLASGGFPRGKLYWLLDGHPLLVSLVVEEWHEEEYTGVYTVNSSVSVNVTEGSQLQCVIENPLLKVNTTVVFTHSTTAHTHTDSPNSNTGKQEGVHPTQTASAIAGVSLLLILLSTALLVSRFRHKWHRPTQISVI